MTRTEQQDIMILLGNTVAQRLKQPYEQGSNADFLFSWKNNTCVIALVIHPEEEDDERPYLKATITTLKGRELWYRLMFDFDDTKIGLLSNSGGVGYMLSPSAVEIMEKWPVNLHPHLRAIFVTLCQQLDALRQPAAG